MSETSNDIMSNLEQHNEMWKETFQKISDTLTGKNSSSDDSSKSNTTTETKVSDSGTNKETTKKEDTSLSLDDIKINEKVDISTLKKTISEYLKDKGDLKDAGSIFETISQGESFDLNILIVIAISVWQTRNGTTLALKNKHNPGCITGATENDSLADLKAGCETMIKQLDSHLTDANGVWLSSTRLWYVKKAVSVDDAIGLENDDLKQLKASEKTDTATLQKQQLTWYEKLRSAVNDVYKELVGADPKWEKRKVDSKDASKSASSGGRSSDKGVKVEKKIPHGKHGENDPDQLLVVLPKNETFSEPVYPDLLTVADNVPQYIETKSTIKKANDKFYDIGNGITISQSYLDSTTATDNTKKADGQTDLNSVPSSMTTTTQNGTTVSTTKDDTKGTSKTTLSDESKTPDDRKTNKKTSTSTDSNTSSNTNTNSDTGGTSTTNNSVNQTTPSSPYVNGEPVSSGTADSALNAINQLTNNQLNEVVGNMADREARQIVYDPKKHKNSFKMPTKGKPANNNDAFPIDLKLEELELHYPHAYIHQIQACPQAVTTATALLEHAQATEKRIVKLENNMATLLRYFGALGTRININCVYWGGTSQYAKVN